MKQKKFKLGLALGSGGLRGLAHIGVLKVLEQNGIKIDYLCGSSIGGLVAAYYSAFPDVDKLEQEIESWPIKSLYKFFDLSWRGGLIAGDKISSFLDEKFGELSFSQLQIPLHIVATDLSTGEPVVFSSGKVSTAIRSTISVPLMFKPMYLGEKSLVDGAISSPVPLRQLKDMGARNLIGVNLYHKNEFVKRRFTMPKVALRSTRIALYNLAQHDIKEADVVISPDTSAITSLESLQKYNIQTLKKLIKIGEQSAIKALPEIKALLK